MNLFGSKIFIIKYLKELMNIFYSLKYTNEFLILNKCSVLFLFSLLALCMFYLSFKKTMPFYQEIYAPPLQKVRQDEAMVFTIFIWDGDQDHHVRLCSCVPCFWGQ